MAPITEFQDRCLKPLGHPSVFTTQALSNAAFGREVPTASGARDSFLIFRDRVCLARMRAVPVRWHRKRRAPGRASSRVHVAMWDCGERPERASFAHDRQNGTAKTAAQAVATCFTFFFFSRMNRTPTSHPSIRTNSQRRYASP